MGEKKYQACAPATQFFGAEAFEKQDKTTVRWLGNASVFINCRGVCMMIDPLLTGFHTPLLIDMPILTKDVPHLDAILITHSDGDHYSKATCGELAPRCHAYHSTQYVAGLMEEEGLSAFGHDIDETFEIGPIRITLTPVDHAWQNEFPQEGARVFQLEDCCGFWIETPDGTIWIPGDSRLLSEQLEMPTPDAIIMDFSDSPWHFGLEGAAKLANAYPQTPLLLIHWGTMDAPDEDVFNGDPDQFAKLVTNPDRIHAVPAGEPFVLQRLTKS